jgi:type III secretory pathway component EscU
MEPIIAGTDIGIFLRNVYVLLGYAVLALFIFFRIVDWLFEKYDIRKKNQEKREREFYAKWRTIRHD